MSTLTRWYPGDRNLELVLVAALGVALVSSVACLITRRLAGRAALRHLVLCSALVCCLAFPVVAWLGGAAGLTLVTIPVLRGEPSGSTAGVTRIEATQVGRPPQPTTDPHPAAVGPPSPRTNANASTNTTADRAATASEANQSLATPTPPVPDMQPVGGQPATLLTFRDIATGAMAVWAAGTVLLLVRLAWNCGRVVRLRRSSRPLPSEPHQLLLREIAATLGMRPVPLLLVSSRTVTPMAVGFGRPAVVLPDRLLGAVSDDALRDVLMHEAAHLQRGDLRIVLLQALAGALYWPILSVHALNRELQRAREEVCDNIVLAGRDALSYGETLLRVAELVVTARPMGAAVGIFGGHGELERRIAGLIDPRRNPTTTTGRVTRVAVLSLFVAVGVIAVTTRFAASAPPDPPVKNALPVPKPPDNFDPADPKYAGYFRGTVNGPDGKPLAGANIYILPFESKRKEPGTVRATTDADGRFEFDAPDMTYPKYDGRPARYDGLLVATKDGHGPDWFHTWGTKSDDFREWWTPVKNAKITLHLAKDDVPVRGRFLDPAGKPLAGASVRLTSINLPNEFNLDTHLETEAKASMYRGFLSGAKTHERSLGRLNLIPGLTTETKTDADGRFEFTGVGRDRLADLNISAPAVANDRVEVMSRVAPDVGTIRDKDGKTTHTIHGSGFTKQLTPGFTVKGVVRDRQTKAPIPGMWVTKNGHPVTYADYNENPAVTDANGRFAITGLDPWYATAEKDRRDIAAYPQPGTPYLMAKEVFDANGDVVIECVRGIPFRLKVVDEAGKPVEGDVFYRPISPNPVVEDFIKPLGNSFDRNSNPAAQRADGTYDGFVLPGPGAVVVDMPYDRTYRPALVDPKTFFAPGRTDWPAGTDHLYGTRNVLATIPGGDDPQTRYEAIVLVNPAADSKPLELAATVVKDRPRQVTLLDPDGKPVVGVQSYMRWPTRETQEELNSATFVLKRLHPERVKQMTFFHDDRKLAGILVARGDSADPITVRMQAWAVVTGRLVDQAGTPVAKSPHLSLRVTDAGVVESRGRTPGNDGGFRIEKLIPGLSYDSGSPGYSPGFSTLDGKPVEKLILKPGEVRDLGDVRVKPADAKSETAPGK